MRADYDCATCEDASPIFCNYACRFGILLEIIERLESLTVPRLVDGDVLASSLEQRS
jgi:hypothetical protein